MAPHGRQLLPSALDELAQVNPKRLYAAIPRTADLRDGFRDISVADLARCVDYMAAWIAQCWGRIDGFETLTYLGITDLRGPIVFLAAVKCGYKVFLPSPRNQPSVNFSLMSQTSSTKLLHAPELAPLASKIGEEGGPALEIKAVPSFDEMMESSPEKYPFEKNFDKARSDPIVVLHSSGSTGRPKPVIITHGALATLDNEHNLPTVPGRTNRDSTIWQFDGEARVFLVFPFFHLGGFLFFTVNAIFRNSSPVLGPPHMIPDGALLKSVLQHQKLRALFLVPSVVEQLLQEPNGIELFRHVDVVAWAGAPPSPTLGDRLAEVVYLISPYGSTETFLIPELSLSPQYWAWHEFNPLFKHEMRPYDAKNRVFELVIFADESTQDTSAVYHTLPGVSEYHTKDLFLQHPENPNIYKYYGRLDDIIVLANGEKVNPVPLEVQLQSHGSLNGALMVGHGRTKTALLVEPREPLDEHARSELLESIWPLVEDLNSLVPGQGRVARGMLLVSSPERPLAKTAKGNVVRKLAEQAYADEIDRLYSDDHAPGKLVSVSLKSSVRRVYERENVMEFLRGILAASFSQVAVMSPDEDFYSHGLDSVMTLEITANLRRNVQEQTSGPVGWISPRTIYRNPTLASLSDVMVKFLGNGVVPDADHRLENAAMVERAVAAHVEALPKRSKPAQSPISSRPSKVAIIGSTGYLGSYLVLELLRDQDIAHVYCLNRRSDAQRTQEAALLEMDGTVASLLPKLRYMTIKFGEEDLGLQQHDYDLVAREVDVIIYNAWRLDFALALRSFEPFLRTLRDVAALATEGRDRPARVIFVSSLSSVAAMAAKTGVPEAPVHDGSAALNFGYAQSKLAAERILAIASRDCGLAVSLVRVCQTGGASAAADGGHGDGAGVGADWADQAWLSALLRTSKAMGCMPSGLAPVDLVPVDTVASILAELVTSPPTGDSPQVVNVRPPQSTPWAMFLDIMRETYGVTATVPLRDWIVKLRALPVHNADVVARMPAVKLLEYYEELSVAGQSASVVQTGFLDNLSQVKVPVVERQTLEAWLRSWKL
ncbi:acetyl-CoA synthetase-like protein [Xylariomycetidae sp. FL2044]|nr:acetyl-CoA synthetase-like protein [Xylariomycetidae sp. FL2044]